MELKTNSTQALSILFVEDDEVTLKILSSVLAVRFPAVMFYTAINGRLGLELFKAHTPDIVITDINMPVMCGVQMVENIRALTTGTMFIAITGKSGETSDKGKFILRNSEGKMTEFDHVIVKPVDLSELCGVTEQYIGEIKQRTS